MATNTSTSNDKTTGDEIADEAKTAVQKLRDQADAVVQRLQPQFAAVTSFARDEPTKAVLISAATGAALMALIALLVRSDSRPSAPARSAMATIRDAALDLADRAHSAATDAIDRAHQRGADTATSADKLSGSLVDAWHGVRDRAAPVVDRLRPQIDAVASYARDDPAKTALGVAIAGAALIGLLSLIRSSESD